MPSEPDRIPGKEVHHPGQDQADAQQTHRVPQDAVAGAPGLPGGSEQAQHQSDARAHDEELDHMAADEFHGGAYEEGGAGPGLMDQGISPSWDVHAA